MSTLDGIDANDWEAVQDLAIDVVNAPDHEKTNVRQLLLDYLDTLEARYGTLPSILATRADYLEDDDPKREQLLLRAYELAESRTRYSQPHIHCALPSGAVPGEAPASGRRSMAFSNEARTHGLG
jgi:hypothetical protein